MNNYELEDIAFFLMTVSTSAMVVTLVAMGWKFFILGSGCHS